MTNLTPQDLEMESSKNPSASSNNKIAMRQRGWLNQIMGWLVFAIALLVYTLTLEPSVSLWDCGEFASAAYKLQVVHPPGAPLFLLIGRLFSLMASSPENAGYWMNMVSAVASAGCVMFTFWITTYFAERIVSDDNQFKTILVLGAGTVAALTNTFIDTFWFSAVESEVYALSSFFTTLTFWAVLRWWKTAEDIKSDRWLVFIAYLIGLSLGNHMLNMLVIPCVCLAYYFRKKTITPNGVLMALGAAAISLGFVMKIIYPGIPWLMARMDRLFVNDFGLPFYSGTIAAIVLIALLAGFLLFYTHSKGKRNWNIMVMSALCIIIGYSSYAMVIIRSKANPAIDMNNPEDPYKFYGYITREQYGDRPLIYGPYFNAPEDGTKSLGTRYFKGKNQYEEGGENYDYTYDDEYMTLFPRMGKSNKPNDARGFREYGGMSDVQNSIDEIQGLAQQQQRAMTEEEIQESEFLNYEKPTFLQNMKYFFNYQVRYMYLRYFMWNFVGRFNDQQAVMGNTRFDGNWYSGIPFIDCFVVGPRKGLPDFYKNQKGKNAYFFLPLLLGMLGLIWQATAKKYDFWLVMTLFIFTGLLINVYMNQPPYEPRERDYALVGSFQTFCIWVGLGVLAFAEIARNFLRNNLATAGAIVFSLLLVPGNMAYQNWDDHDRSGRSIGIDMAKNFLGNLEPNAILFCNGDNDTYPLWYAQNVEGFRKDVRIINQSLLPTDWYSSVLLNKVYASDPLPLTLTKKDLQTGSFDGGIEIVDPNGVTSLAAAVRQVIGENNLGDERNYLKARKVSFPVNRKAVIASGLVRGDDTSQIVNQIEYSIGGSYISKGDLVFMDLICENARQGWKRPIYFTSVSGYDFYDLNDYLQLEGLVYKFVPIRGGSNQRQPQRVAEDKLYKNLVKNYRYCGMKQKKNFFLDDKAAYVPGDLQQMASLLARTYLGKISVYNQYAKAVREKREDIPVPPGYASIDAFLAIEGKKIAGYRKKGIEVIGHILTEIPENAMPMRKEYKADYGLVLLELGDTKTAKKTLDLAVKDCTQFARYFVRWENETFGAREVQSSRETLKGIIDGCKQLGRKDWAAEYTKRSEGI